MRTETRAARRRLYLLSRLVVARHYRRRLTLAVVARALSSSPRQLQRVYAQFGELSFHEDLLARRMTAAAQLLIEQPGIAVRDVARLVGYQQASHFALAFRRRYGLSPARFRETARANVAGARTAGPSAAARAPAAGAGAGASVTRDARSHRGKSGENGGHCLRR